MRRWLPARKWKWIVPATILIVLFGAGAIAWYVWLPRYRPALARGESYGVDVSSNQGYIDWSKVARSGVAYAYIKATEGTSYTDPDFATNLAAAKAAGLTVGAYHFFTLCTPGASQASNYLKSVRVSSVALPPALDLELPGNCSARPLLSEVESQLDAFVTKVEAATGQSPVFYIGESFEDRYPIETAERGMRWKRSLYVHPSGPWVVWQFNARAHVPGVAGRVDLDIFKTAVLSRPAAG